jgi:hypothetical protein
LKTINTITDPERGIEGHVPNDPEHFGSRVTVEIGPADASSVDLFYFFACSPTWFAAGDLERPWVWGRHYLFLNRYDAILIRQAIEDICRRAAGDTWEAVSNYIRQYGYWEFEDYNVGRTPA